MTSRQREDLLSIFQSALTAVDGRIHHEPA